MCIREEDKYDSFWSPEKSLQVLRQFRPARVAGVHRDEDADARYELDVLAEEVEDLPLVTNGVLDALDLDGDDRQNLDRYAVELVETAPGAGLRQALVDVSDRLEQNDNEDLTLERSCPA